MSARRLPFVVYDAADAHEALLAESARCAFVVLDGMLARGWEPETPASWEVEREAFMRELDAPSERASDG